MEKGTMRYALLPASVLPVLFLVSFVYAFKQTTSLTRQNARRVMLALFLFTTKLGLYYA